MTINEIIMVVDDLKPNAYSNEQKLRWLSDVDGKIVQEIFKEKTVSEYHYPKDEGRELIVKAPHSDLYKYYLFAMIDFANGEFGEYNNSMAMFNSSYDIFAKWYLRNNVPKGGGRFKNII